MTKLFQIAVVATLLAACTSSYTVSPTGQPGASFRCTSLQRCRQVAHETCPVGYNVLATKVNRALGYYTTWVECTDTPDPAKATFLPPEEEAREAQRVENLQKAVGVIPAFEFEDDLSR